MKTYYYQKSIILASQSPRRRMLLEQAGIEFQIKPSNTDERLIPFKTPDDFVIQAASQKAKTIAKQYPDAWIIGADTMVILDHHVMGKPLSMDEARSMLTQLAGRVHHVYTGVCIGKEEINQFHTEYVKSEVLFKALSKEEIEWYLHTDEPYDKAGAYAVQGLGSFMVKHIHGSYTNVVGLPVCEVMELLTRLNIIQRKIHINNE